MNKNLVDSMLKISNPFLDKKKMSWMYLYGNNDYNMVYRIGIDLFSNLLVLTGQWLTYTNHLISIFFIWNVNEEVLVAILDIRNKNPKKIYKIGSWTQIPSYNLGAFNASGYLSRAKIRHLKKTFGENNVSLQKCCDKFQEEPK